MVRQDLHNLPGPEMIRTGLITRPGGTKNQSGGSSCPLCKDTRTTLNRVA